MNVLLPVSSIMTTQLITVDPKDPLTTVRDIFAQHNIHHIPVVRYKQLVGLVSKTDFQHFMIGFSKHLEDRFINETRLRAFTVEEVMTEKLATLSSSERINVALDLFMVNRFHAIPIVDNGELVGILTTFDIIKALASEDISSDQIIASLPG